MAADCAGTFRATMQSAPTGGPPPCVLRFPLHPNLPPPPNCPLPPNFPLPLNLPPPPNVPPPPNHLLPPNLSHNIPLLNHLRRKSRSQAMASSRPLYEFVGEIPPDLLCGICLLVPHDPHRVTCCGRFFCRLCITEWTMAQRFQCPSCFRPNCSHHSDPSLSQRILHLPVYCTSRHKGCSWQGLMGDLQVHLSSEEGCFFSPVDCPLSEYGCQTHLLQRRDLAKHMADKHTKHIKMILGNLKHTSSRLEMQEKQIDDLQQRFLMFVSQLSCTMQAHSALGNKTTLVVQDLAKMKLKVSELEEALLKVRPHSLNHLDRALSDTFPPLKYFAEEEGKEDVASSSDEVMSLNGSLLHGLKEIEEQRVVGVVSNGIESEEGAGLPIGGDLPTESAGTGESGVSGESEEKGEGVRGVTQLAQIESDHTNTLEVERDVNSDPRESCTLNPAQYSAALPTYATAVSNPFHPAMKGVSKCPDSIPVNHQSSVSRPLPTNTVSISEAVTMTTVTTDMHHHHVDKETAVTLPSNSHTNDNPTSQLQILTTAVHVGASEPKSDFQTGQQSGSDRSSELSAQLTDVLGEGLGALAQSGPAGWSMGWSDDGVCTPRSDSSLSLKSSSSSEMSFTGDTVIQYGTSTVVVSTTSGKKSPSPDHTQVKLFVKYMPHCCSPEKAVSLFLAYGKVHLLEYHSEHRDKLFLIMDREGGLQAMSALNGTRLEGSPKPLSVQLYRSVPTSSTPILQRSESITKDKSLRLFVKHLGSDMTINEITELFSSCGRVFDVQKHPNRRNVAFVYMCEEGGKKAIANLNGYHSAQITRPLLVELSHEPTASVTKPC